VIFATSAGVIPCKISNVAAVCRARVNEYWQRLDPDYIDGEGAESFRQFIGRAKTALDRLNRLADGSKPCSITPPG